MYLEIFLADFAVFCFFWEFCWISRKYLNFVGPRLREIAEALSCIMKSIMKGLIASFDVDHNLYQLHFVNSSQALMYNIKVNSYHYVDCHQCLRILLILFGEALM